MGVETTLALVVGAWLAYVNGANDVAKGVATLVGSGLASQRCATAWGAGWTVVGALLGAWLGTAMLNTFGYGLVQPPTGPALRAGVAALSGAAAWVLLATRGGLPVSTTHALVGAMVGVAYFAYGPQAVHWTTLGGSVLLPLLLSPLLACALSWLLLPLLRSSACGGDIPDCLCAEARAPATPVCAMGPADGQCKSDRVISCWIASRQFCEANAPGALRVTFDHLHWLTSGWVSLARGLNDAPKIVALITVTTALAGRDSPSVAALFAMVGAAMLAGSVVGSARVTDVMARKVVKLDSRGGFSANLVTAVLVGSAACWGMPVSTTHVSLGGIVGAGSHAGVADRRLLGEIIIAWLVTLPVTGVAGVAAFAGLGLVLP